MSKMKKIILTIIIVVISSIAAYYIGNSVVESFDEPWGVRVGVSFLGYAIIALIALINMAVYEVVDKLCS